MFDFIKRCIECIDTHFMHFSNNPSEQVSISVPGRIRTLLLAISLSTASCIGPQNTHGNIHAFQTEEMAECDIDNPVFISLVGIGAELQTSINADEKNGYTLEYVWQALRSELEKRTEFKDVSVSIVSPIKTERGYIYMELSATDMKGKVWKNGLYARDKNGADEKIQCLRDNFMLYIKEKIQYITPSGMSLEKDAITQILQIEKEGLEKHEMTYEVRPDGENWIIVFHYTGEEKFGLICLGEEAE